MRYIHIIFLFLILSQEAEVLAQFYNQWPMGYDTFYQNGWGMSIVDFNDKQVSVIPPIPTEYWIDGNSSFICDASGKLELMSNGCVILDKKAQLIPNGDSLFNGQLFDWNCPERAINVQNTLLLPDLDNSNFSILLNKDTDLNKDQTSFISKGLYHSSIQSTGGQHVVVIKSMPLRTTEVSPLNILAVPHIDGKHWWLIESGEEASSQFLTYIVSKDTAYFVRQSITGPEISLSNFSGSQMAVSPDGKKIAWQGKNMPIYLYNLDRSTGQISFDFQIAFNHTVLNDSSTLGTLCFSPNSEFLYHSDGYYISQIEISNKDVIEVGHIGRTTDPFNNFPVFAIWMHLGPDCRIYIAPGTTTSFLHTINYPNRKGVDCNVQFKAIDLPSLVSNRMPNRSFYHLGMEGVELCDSSIRAFTTSTIDNGGFRNHSFQLYPNPSSEESGFSVVFDQVFSGDLDIITTSGQKLYSASISGEKQKSFSPYLSKGIYFVKIQSHCDGGIATRKLVVQ